MGLVNFLQTLAREVWLGFAVGIHISRIVDAAQSLQSLSQEDSQAYGQFLIKVLQATANSKDDSQVVYPLLAKNTDKLDGVLAEILRRWGTNTLREADADEAKYLAAAIVGFSNLIQQFPLGDKASNMEIAITGYEVPLTVYTRDRFPYEWAMTQHNLGAAYCDRIAGEKRENLESAIACFTRALEELTRDRFPQDWAMTQYNLGLAYWERIAGEKRENVETAIACFTRALAEYTRDRFPQQWAMTQHNLGAAYWNRIAGEKRENLESAIACYTRALAEYSRDRFPQDWADTQNNLGSAYWNRIAREKGENLESAIACFTRALEERTRDRFPYEWAVTQQNLGLAYCDRIAGEKGENVETAIACFTRALEERTRDRFPYEWARTQNNLGNAYSDRIAGEKRENLEQAIACYTQALEEYTRERFPYDWAMTQNNLGNAYRDRIAGEKRENLEQAIACFTRALEELTRDRFPQDWATTQQNLGTAYCDRIAGEKGENLESAINCHTRALEEYTRDRFPYEWARTQQNLGSAYWKRIAGEKRENVEQAITCYTEALKVFRPQALPNNCRNTAWLLGNLYARENRWTEATQPYQTALEAVEVLYEQSLTLTGKQEELAATGDLFHRTACALTRVGNLESAAVTLERGRARNLSETLARDRADLEQVQLLAPAVYASYQEAASLLRELEAQERLRSTLEAKNEVRATPQANLQQILQARKQLNQAKEQIRQLPGYENFLALPTFADISRALQPHQPLIYLTTTEYGSLALIVHRTATTDATVTSLQIDSLTDAGLRELLVGTQEAFLSEESWFGAYFNRQNNPQNWFDTIDAVTNQLWSKLMEPVISHLQQKGVQQAVLIPTGLLGLLPLHAAWTEDAAKPSHRRYALDEIAFTYAPNALSLNNARDIARRISPNTILAVDEPRPVSANPLPNSEREVQTAIETFPNHRLFKHEQAKQPAVKNALANYSVLHFSCHGYANFNEPLDSGLLMANDERLSLRDLFDLRLTGIRLAVLSACETALPGIETIDEVISLPIGMLQAGVAGVAASLWSVADISTMMLMARFYDLWRKENLELPEALGQAQQWVRDTTNGEKVAYFKNLLPEFSTSKMAADTADALYKQVIRKRPDARDFAHPFYWAAFTYTGV
jgi:CHAT domain-containing protein/tetratricopeptide (TPR) repeat protein